MQRETARREPLPQRQGQAQQGQAAKYQVQEHCRFRIVVPASLSQPAPERKGPIAGARRGARTAKIFPATCATGRRMEN